MDSDRLNPNNRFKIINFIRKYQWLILVLLFLITITLGYTGFREHRKATNAQVSPTNLFYWTLQLFVIESGGVSEPANINLEIARWAAPILTAYASILAMATIFRDQLLRIRIRFFRNHIVICGLGDKGFQLARDYTANGFKVVAIEVDEHNPNLSACLSNNIPVIIGDARTMRSLNRSNTVHAHRIITVCGDDGMNAEVAARVKDIALSKKQGPLNCTIHIIDPALRELLRVSELAIQVNTNFRLDLFNIYDLSSQILLNENPIPLDENSSTHLLFIGLSNLGECAIRQYGRLWYSRQVLPQGKIKATILAKDAERRIKSMVLRYPHITDCFTFVAHERRSKDVDLQPIFQQVIDNSHLKYDFVLISIPESTTAIQAALAFQYQYANEQVPIVISTGEQDGLANLILSGGVAESHMNIRLFSPQSACTAELIEGGTNELLAQAVHEEYRREKLLTQTVEMSPSIAAWQDLSEELKESNRKMVDHLQQLLSMHGYSIQPLFNWDAIGFVFDEHDVVSMARKEHERWLEEKQASGWKYGEVKDEKEKTNPAVVEWPELPDNIKEFNYEQIRDIPIVLYRGGFEIIKRD